MLLGNYFDSRLWVDLSPDVRTWLRQAAKMGIEIYSGAQDFAQVDVSYRRLCNNVFQIQKLAGSRRPSNTKPEIKYIWGVCLEWSLDPRSFKGSEAEMKKAWAFPSFFFIERHFTELFDTRQVFIRSRPQPFRHIERFCPKCGYKHTFHT